VNSSRLLILAAAALASAACSHAGSNGNAFNQTDVLQTGTVLHIRNGAGDIRVVRGSGPNVTMHASTSWRRGRESDIRFITQQHGNDYYVCAMWRNSGRCDGNYRGRSTGGFLTMFSLFHRNSDAVADFTVEIPPNIAVDAHTTLGSLDIQGANAGVRGYTVNGTIRASNVSGPMTLTTTNGDVRVSADSLGPNDSVKLMTTNGSVHAQLPRGVEGNFDLSTINGSVRSDIPLEDAGNSVVGRHLAGQVGNAVRSLRMRAINGEVIVATKPANGETR
jgi:hypothetical protein